MVSYFDEEDPEEKYKEEIKEELTSNIESFVMEGFGEDHSETDIDLLRDFIGLTYNQGNSRNTAIVNSLATIAYNLSGIDDPETNHQLDTLQFMYAFHSFRHHKSEEEKDHYLDVAAASLRGVCNDFAGLNHEELRERVLVYDNLLSAWYKNHHPKEEPSTDVQKERAKERAIRLIEICNADIVEFDEDDKALEMHLEELYIHLARYYSD
ncbi:hypothetical protein GOV06_00340 [Candidatus Woesearchaeota archaeon]|nr:hypothetical protein [Candidatus Woesearchaeota archaeon]